MTTPTTLLHPTPPDSVNPYDCISGVYSEYDEDTLNRFIQEMEKLND